MIINKLRCERLKNKKFSSSLYKDELEVNEVQGQENTWIME